MEHFDRKTLEDSRRYIATICRISPYDILINEFGRFEIHQIAERDKNRMEMALRQDDYISNLTCSPSGYDFSRINYAGLPPRKYTITGTISKPIQIDDNIDINI